jgi:hypothetical protein
MMELNNVRNHVENEMDATFKKVELQKNQNPNAVWVKLIIDHARLHGNVITYDNVNDLLTAKDFDEVELMEDIFETVQQEGIQVVDEITDPSYTR